ncbi:MAG: AAA family ATPase [Azoarcus sp.]|nr:AAA family ATPase [Azoarcus sp.]
MAKLELKFLGEFGVLRDGRALPLPPSKKTRALLAYLCLNARKLRREQLCELLWEVPDDPRGSLRWSLSKLRGVLDDEGRAHIVADRTHVAFDAGDLFVDSLALQALAASDLAQASTETLEAAAARYSGTFLEGLEFADFHDFHSWCVAERERAARAQAAVLQELVARLKGDPERALPHARALVGSAPYDEGARATLVRLLVAARHVDEADQQVQLGMRMLKDAGIASTGVLARARRRVPEPAVEREPPPPAREPPPPAREPPPPAREPPPPEREPPPPIREPAGDETLIGRDEEWRTLAAALATSAAGQAQVILLRGEPGMGKSRLLDCLADHARGAAHLLRASAFETEAIRPFALWLDALRASTAETARAGFGDMRADSRDRLFAGLSDLIAAEAQQHCVLLMFDDVHWCDESSAAALHYVMRMNGDRPILAVLAARESELRDNRPLQQALRGLRRDGLLRELRLEPMTESAIVELVRARAPGADARRLGHECGGNPLLALELARAERDGGTDAGGSLEELVHERLARFDPEGADVLRWAAVLSPRIELSVLAQLTGLDQAAVGQVLEEAVQQAMLRATDDGGLRFAHELIARAVYNGISPMRRQLMHRRVAEWMEQDLAFELSRAADLAHHATHSGDAGLGARALVAAGRLCLRFFANHDALSLARKGLELAAQLPAAEQVRVSIDLHDVMLWAAPPDDWQDAARHFTVLAEQALDHGAPAHARQAYQMAAWLRWEHGNWAGAREQSLQSERVARGGGDEEHIVGMAETAKCLVMLERDLAQADAMLMEAQALASRRHFAHRAIPAGLGLLRFYENRLDEAEELFLQARTLCKSAGDRINEYMANEYLVMVDIQRGRWQAARERSAELALLGGKLCWGSEAPFALALLGLCALALEDESATLDTALKDLRLADAKHRLAYVQTRAALLDCERGRHDAAHARAGEALACAQALERATEMLVAQAVLSQCALACGDHAGAEAYVHAVERLETVGVAAWAVDIARRAKECGRKQHA